MGSFWRGFCKVFFWISFIVMALADIVVSIILMGSGSTLVLAFVILLGGLIVIVGLHAVFGMLLEFFDNVAAIKRQVCGNGPIPAAPMPVPQAAPIPAPVPQAAPAPMPVPQAVSAPVPQFVSDFSAPAEAWYCTQCGTKNEPDNVFCVSCGKRQ